MLECSNALLESIQVIEPINLFCNICNMTNHSLVSSAIIPYNMGEIPEKHINQGQKSDKGKGLATVNKMAIGVLYISSFLPCTAAIRENMIQESYSSDQSDQLFRALKICCKL